MRLARLAAETGFLTDPDTVTAAQANAHNLADISAERIFAELEKILAADLTYGVPDGHYRGLLLLRELGLWKYIIPEIEEGIGCAQNPKYHAYDVFGHTVRTVFHAPPELRLAALLHDIAKPYCLRRDGNMHSHSQEGAAMAKKILKGLKCSNAVIMRVSALVEHHTYGNDAAARINKLKIFVAENADIIGDLVKLKYADFLAKGVYPNGVGFGDRLLGVYGDMLASGVPTSVRELKLGGEKLAAAGAPPKERSKILKELLRRVIIGELENEEQALTRAALRIMTNDRRPTT